MSAFAGMEIFNGVIRRLEGSPYATDCWDKRLSQGERMWGYAHDDSHEPGDRFLGWNMVWSADRGVDALVEALRHGRFYASTGVVIRKLESDGMQVHIEAENADRIVAVDILGILIVGICGVLALTTGRSWYLDIGIVWALQSFIGSLALAKFLEGRRYDD